MRKKIFLFLFSFIFVFNFENKADEGMWIPMLLKKYNIEDMKKKGFKLTAEDIYSVNQICMKDAVMIFGGGCTGELISDEGLLITNHHCGYGQIQKHSSLKNDYLTDGFWAMSREEELANPNLNVTFLVRIEDLTERILKDVDDNLNEKERQEKIASNIAFAEAEAREGTNYKAKVKSFFYGNEYYLFVSEVYKDVRLVGAPPSAIGKFGGDTDNWMWPRHTGDFSIFRIYADKDNKPAEYSADNVPYKPKKHFPISLKGVEKGDFTMVFGYPGRTEEYLTSFAIASKINTLNPSKINIRQKKIDIMLEAMNKDRKVRIQYASKHAGTSNAWKKWIGEKRGLERLNAIGKKKKLEKQFSLWAKDQSLKIYSELLPRYEKIYEELTTYSLASDYFYEAGYSLDIIRFVTKFKSFKSINKNTPEAEIKSKIFKLNSSIKSFFKDYDKETDKKIFTEILKIYYKNTKKNFRPDIFNIVEKKFKGDINKYADYFYKKSIFVDQKKLRKFLDKFKASKLKKLKKDPSYQMTESLIDFYVEKIAGKLKELELEVLKLNRFYLDGLQKMQKDKIFYPDANFTLRVAYGNVDTYSPKDGIKYKHYTTLDGIIEKDNPEIYDYDVPDKLKELYKNKDYGKYADKNGNMRVCFTASNHTTGGNSGSPVINGNGELIGVNFDRNWEGTMSDIMYDPDQCRNITLDIRYALFIIDKFAGASHLIQEMTLIE